MTTAQSAVNAAQSALDKATADFNSATVMSARLHALATDAATASEASKRAVGALVRSLAQRQSGAATAEVLVGDSAAEDLLDQLGSLDQLAQLSGNLDTVRERTLAADKRATELFAQAQTADELARGIPVQQAREALAAAQAALAAARAQLTALLTSGISTGSPRSPFSMSSAFSLFSLPDAADTGQLSDQGWISPVVGTISDGFGPRPVLPTAGVGEFHYGTDVAAGCGSPIRAATDGTVASAGPNGTLGNWVLISNGDGVETGYGHIADGLTLVAVGDPVAAGQVIAGVGSTGASTGCHLHFEVHLNGVRVDPQPFLAQRGVILGQD
ncbi:peptidoglycan DD-metalloendopeptidase family protein [Leifsonia sp. YAF41]